MTSQAFPPEQMERVSRQTALREMGEEKRDRLFNASVLVIGAGGLGSPVIQYLASSGIGRLLVIDHDTVSLSNLSRQVLHGTQDLDRPKVESARDAIARLTPFTEIVPVNKEGDFETLSALAAQVDLIIDASDNLATRIAASRASRAAKVPLLFGSAIRWSGQVGLFDPRDENAPCLECVFETDAASNDVKAASVGVASPVTGLVGTLMATEALKKLAGIAPTLDGKLLMVDALYMSFQTIGLMRNPACTQHGH